MTGDTYSNFFCIETREVVAIDKAVLIVVNAIGTTFVGRFNPICTKFNDGRIFRTRAGKIVAIDMTIAIVVFAIATFLHGVFQFFRAKGGHLLVWAL